MITFDLVSPNGVTDAGEISLLITITNGDEPTENFLDSIIIKVNDMPISVELSYAEITIEATASFIAIGNQHMRLTAEADDGSGLAIKHFDIFISPESSHRNPDYVYAPLMERIGSYFPGYTRAGADRYSVFQQLLNPIALELDRVRQKLQSHNRSLSIGSANLSDPDWLYQYELEDDEAFTHGMNTEGAQVIIPPSVFGFTDINRIDLVAKESFRDFWEEAIPTRFVVLESTRPALAILSPSTPIQELATIPPFDVPTLGRIYIHIHSASNLVDIQLETLGQTILQVSGLSPSGANQTENITILENGTIATKWRWSRVTSVGLLKNIESASAEVVLSLFPPRLGVKTEPSYQSVKDRRVDTIKWEVGEDGVGSYLDKLLSGQSHVIDIAKGENTFLPVQRYRLTSLDDNFITISDFTMESSGNFLYGISENKLMIWDRRDCLPTNLTLLTGITEQPEQGFEVVTYDVPTVQDDAPVVILSVELERPLGVKTARSWSWSVRTPADEVFYIKPSTGELSTTEYWYDNPIPISYYGIKERNFDLTLDELGDYIFELRILYTDNSTDIVRRVFQFHKKRAIAEYDLSHLVTFTDDISQIHMTDSNELWISNAEAIYKLRSVYDTFLIDVDENCLYFREDYDDIEVKFNE